MARVRADLNRPKWTSLGKMDQNGPFWSILVSRMLNPVRNKVILTKMVVWTILDHFGPVHFPTVPRPFPKIQAPAISRVKLAKFLAKLVANFRRSLEGDFRASFAGENRQKHFPPKLHRKFHHQTSLRGSGLWRALRIGFWIGRVMF